MEQPQPSENRRTSNRLVVLLVFVVTVIVVLTTTFTVLIAKRQQSLVDENLALSGQIASARGERDRAVADQDKMSMNLLKCQSQMHRMSPCEALEWNMKQHPFCAEQDCAKGTLNIQCCAREWSCQWSPLQKQKEEVKPQNQVPGTAL